MWLSEGGCDGQHVSPTDQCGVNNHENQCTDVIPVAWTSTLGFTSRLSFGCQKLFYAEANNLNRVNII